ncbi:MAG: SCO family protein, partial [Verrucomicrobiota bacterium]
METSPASDPTPPEPKRFPPVIIYTVGIAIILMVLWSVFLQRSMAPYQVRSSKIELRNYSMIEDFSLTDHRNEALTREDLDGKIWVTNFIFTSCARECPILNQKMARLQEEFLSQPKVEFVSISVDPETDKPERLAKYAKAFAAGERWHFLT